MLYYPDSNFFDMYTKEYCHKLEANIKELDELTKQLEQYIAELEIFDVRTNALDEFLSEIHRHQEAIDQIIVQSFEFLYEKVAHELEKLHTAGEVIFHSPEALQEKFMEAGMEIPTEEMSRMRLMIGQVSSEEVKSKCVLLKMHTAGNKPPLLMVLPQKVKVKGKIIECTIESLKEKIWPELQAKNTYLKEFYIGDYVTDETKTRTWSDMMIAYTSGTLQNSESKSYDEQKELVADTLGEHAVIQAEMYPAMIFHYLLTGDLLMKYDEDGYMRLHELDKDGDPLCVSCDFDDLKLFSDNTCASDNTGFGSSVVFSRGVST